MTLRRFSVVDDGVRSSWFSLHRPPWWVVVTVAIGLGCEWALLRGLGL